MSQTNGLSETVSQKPKRGRPAKIPPAIMRMLEAMCPELTTRRARENMHYQLLAQQALIHDPAYKWLIDGDAMRRGVPGATYKDGVLRELGRIEDEDAIRVVAGYVCDLKLGTAAAVKFIRWARLGDEKPHGTDDGLAKAIAKVVGAYRSSHEGVDDRCIRDALWRVEASLPDE